MDIFLKFADAMTQQLFYNPSEVPIDTRLVITQGTFDGIHLGHKEVLQHVVSLAKEKNTRSLLLTFHPHPRLVIEPNNSELQMLSSIQEKSAAVFALGVDYILVLPFTQEFSQKSPREFVSDVLVNQLHVDTIVIGYDHRFGKNRSGGFDDLVVLAKEFQFAVHEIPASVVYEIAISSSRIRKALQNKQLKEANELLGRPYAITGTVVEGKHIGRSIGFPTANLLIDDPYKLIPPNGVYAGTCTIQHKTYKMMCNIGVRPTFKGSIRTIEAHILNFDNSIYSETIQLHLVQYLRNEQEFDSIESLKSQLVLDAKQAQILVGLP